MGESESNLQLQIKSSGVHGSYVHPCGSINTIQGKLASIVEEQATHRQLEVETHPLIRQYYPSTCAIEAFEHYCTGPEKHVVHRPIYNPEKKKGHRNTCNICSGSNAKRQAHQTFHEVHGFKWRALRFIDLTTPEDFIPRQMYEDKKACDKKYNQLFQYGSQFMKKEFPGEAFIQTIHTQHSNDPLSPPHFHLHIESSCTEYHKDNEGNISTEYLNSVKSKSDLEGMRKTWGAIIGHEGEVDLHYGYAPRREVHSGAKSYGGPKRVLHRFSYCFRGFIEDVNKWLTQNNIHSLNPEQEYWLKWHLQKWPRRTRRYGAWSNSKQSQFIDMDIVRSRIEEDRERTRKLYCPICFYEVENKAISQQTVPIDKSRVAMREIIHMKRPPSPCMFEKTPIRQVKHRGLDYPESIEPHVKYERRRASEVKW